MSALGTMTQNTRTSRWGDLSEVDGPRGLLKHAHNAFSSVWHTAYGMALAALLNVIPLSMILVGFLNVDQCAVEPYLPWWLIWMGALLLVKYVIDTTLRIYKICCGKEATLSDTHQLGPLDWLFSGLVAIWFLLGSYWLYRTFGRAQFSMSEYSDYCDMLTYSSVFVIIVFIYIVLFLLSCCFFVCCGILCWKLKMDRDQYRLADVAAPTATSSA
ncbi:unnamed protein product [Toxocara canis]|uniref:Transmembrane protein n=1 Tax=Toxocara canis TaxID=6265 RepID=A0A3P7F492_TOXCA|nr:unnamed protein product [Toxocara canis]